MVKGGQGKVPGAAQSLGVQHSLLQPLSEGRLSPGDGPQPQLPLLMVSCGENQRKRGFGSPQPWRLPRPGRAPRGVLMSTSRSPAARAALASAWGGSAYGQATSAASKPARPAACSRSGSPGSSGNNQETLAEKRSGAMPAEGGDEGAASGQEVRPAARGGARPPLPSSNKGRLTCERIAWGKGGNCNARKL